MTNPALIQGSAEWRADRAGSLGASQIAGALARIKSGWGATRANVMAELLAERLTGLPTESYVSEAMQWGTDQEAAAREAYARLTGCEVFVTGIVRHPEIAGTHASPDGLIGDDGLVEIKAPYSATHLDYLLSDTVPGKYIVQVQWQLACTGRKWCDFVSFDPRLPTEIALFVKRIPRDEPHIIELESEVSSFLAELDAKVEQIKARYMQKDAA